VIYLDSSVALAHLLAEDRRPAAGFWRERLISSRLLQYEVWNRVHARGLTRLSSAATRALLSGIELVELAPAVLTRALAPFPIPVRTLDGLHLASMEFLRSGGQAFELGSYDERLLAAAQALGIERAAL
jgi:predicted nucleic acid-binding protein